QKDRHRGHGFAMGFGADVGSDRHLADVEFVAPHHAAERGDEGIDLFELEREGARLDRAVLERPVVALAAGDGFELEFGHGSPAGRYSVVSSPRRRGPYSRGPGVKHDGSPLSRGRHRDKQLYTVVCATPGRVVSASLAASVNA